VAEEGFAWLAGGDAGVDETDAFGKSEKGQRVTNEGPHRKKDGSGRRAARNEIFLHPSHDGHADWGEFACTISVLIRSLPSYLYSML